MTSILTGVTVALPLFAGQAGPLRHIEFTGLGRPLYAGALPASYQVLAPGSAPRCPFRKSLVSVFARQREPWEGMLT